MEELKRKRLTAKRKFEIYLETKKEGAKIGEILRREGIHLNDLRAIEEQGINLRRPVGINYEMKSAADGAIQQQTWAGDITVTATIIATYDF